MQDYDQPDFYRFTQDSLELVSWIKNNYPHDDSRNVLDLCSGCGVIGLELMQAFSRWKVDFCELQESFYPYFIKNAQFFCPGKTPSFFNEDLKVFNLDASRKYDLIVCNPPYFSPEKGRLSPSLERRLCRFFSANDWEELFKCFARSLKVEGKAYFLAREEIWRKNPAIKQLGLLAGAQVFSFDLNI